MENDDGLELRVVQIGASGCTNRTGQSKMISQFIRGEPKEVELVSEGMEIPCPPKRELLLEPEGVQVTCAGQWADDVGGVLVLKLVVPSGV